jgi:hypothetical protein
MTLSDLFIEESRHVFCSLVRLAKVRFLPAATVTAAESAVVPGAARRSHPALRRTHPVVGQSRRLRVATGRGAESRRRSRAERGARDERRYWLGRARVSSSADHRSGPPRPRHPESTATDHGAGPDDRHTRRPQPDSGSRSRGNGRRPRPQHGRWSHVSPCHLGWIRPARGLPPHDAVAPVVGPNEAGSVQGTCPLDWDEGAASSPLPGRSAPTAPGPRIPVFAAPRVGTPRRRGRRPRISLG